MATDAEKQLAWDLQRIANQTRGADRARAAEKAARDAAQKK